MLEEIIQVNLKLNINKIDTAELHLYDEDPDNEDNIKLELHYHGNKIESSSENYFDALTDIRDVLEKDDIQILCKGANRNVYPSAMQLNMGTGRAAYTLTINNQARQKDLVNIFDSSNITECVSVDEQKEYFNLWIKSLE